MKFQIGHKINTGRKTGPNPALSARNREWHASHDCAAHAPKIEPRDDILYSMAHKRIRKARGPASGQVCTDCGRPAQQWSYGHSGDVELIEMDYPYSPDPSDYAPRCVPCHKLFDLGRQPVVVHAS